MDSHWKLSILNVNVLIVLLSFLFLWDLSMHAHSIYVSLFYAQNGLLYVFHSSHAITFGNNCIVMIQSQLWIEFRTETTVNLLLEDVPNILKSFLENNNTRFKQSFFFEVSLEYLRGNFSWVGSNRCQRVQNCPYLKSNII